MYHEAVGLAHDPDIDPSVITTRHQHSDISGAQSQAVHVRTVSRELACEDYNAES